jgi:hypothetical protein
MSKTFTNKEVFGRIHESGTSEGAKKGWQTRSGTGGQSQYLRDTLAKQYRTQKKHWSATWPNMSRQRRNRMIRSSISHGLNKE